MEEKAAFECLTWIYDHWYVAVKWIIQVSSWCQLLNLLSPMQVGACSDAIKPVAVDLSCGNLSKRRLYR